MTAQVIDCASHCFDSLQVSCKDWTSLRKAKAKQPATENNSLLCHWVTIYHLVLKICPMFQVLSSHFKLSEVKELLHEHWARNVQVENISAPIYAQIFICFDQRFEIKNSEVSYLTLIFKMSNPKMKIRFPKDRLLKFARYDYAYHFLQQINRNLYLSC